MPSYIGEQLLPGQAGHFLAVVSLIASLLATISFYKATVSKDLLQQQSWKRIARISFLSSRHICNSLLYHFQSPV
jgi:cytochrome c-type biogenesis protein CcmF